MENCIPRINDKSSSEFNVKCVNDKSSSEINKFND